MRVLMVRVLEMAGLNVKHFIVVFAVFIASAASYAGDLDPTSDAIRSLPKIEIGNAVRMFMQSTRKSTEDKSWLMWDLNANNPAVLWQDTPYTLNQGATRSYREGLMRIAVDGVSSSILTSRVKELAWTVTLWTDSSPKFGIEGVSFNPGLDDGKHNCFGSSAYHCTFNPMRSLQKAGIKAVKVCSNNGGGVNSSVGYKLSAPGKEPVLATLENSGGSGGVSTSFTLHFKHSGTDLCAL